METHKVREGTASKYSCTVVDETDTAIEPASMTTMVLTIYDQATDADIVTARDVLNANGGVLGAGGAFSYVFTAADNTIQGTDSVEKHIALFEWTFNAGARSGKHAIKLMVENLGKVS